MASYGGFSGLARKRQLAAQTASPSPSATPPGYYDLPGSSMLPGGNLSVSPGKGGVPRSIPGVDIPLPGTGGPLPPEYQNTIPGAGAYVSRSDRGGAGTPYFPIGGNIPLGDENVGPTGGGYYTSSGGNGYPDLSGAPVVTNPSWSYPNLSNAPVVTPSGYIMPGSNPYPQTAGASYQDWIGAAVNTDEFGNPIPGSSYPGYVPPIARAVGNSSSAYPRLGGTRAGNWAQNARGFAQQARDAAFRQTAITHAAGLGFGVGNISTPAGGQWTSVSNFPEWSGSAVGFAARPPQQLP